MFSKDQIETLFDELKREYSMESDWEQLVRDAHLGIARSDAGVSLGQIDQRAATAIEKHRGE